jgi:hypothetical protein
MDVAKKKYRAELVDARQVKAIQTRNIGVLAKNHEMVCKGL